MDTSGTDKDAFCLRCGESVFTVAKGLEPKREGMDWITFPCKRTHVWGKQAEVFIAYAKNPTVVVAST